MKFEGLATISIAWTTQSASTFVINAKHIEIQVVVYDQSELGAEWCELQINPRPSVGV